MRERPQRTNILPLFVCNTKCCQGEKVTLWCCVGSKVLVDTCFGGPKGPRQMDEPVLRCAKHKIRCDVSFGTRYKKSYSKTWSGNETRASPEKEPRFFDSQPLPCMIESSAHKRQKT